MTNLANMLNSIVTVSERLGVEYTPDQIHYLPADAVFVFGSNAEGRHGGGAARVAHAQFGAVWGEGEGHYGQSYALPTMGTPEETAAAAARFLQYAASRPDLKFFLTRVGCGIAGYTPADIAPLFVGHPANIILPRDFADIIEGVTP